MILSNLVPMVFKTMIKRVVVSRIEWNKLSKEEQSLREQMDAMDDWIDEVDNNLMVILTHACCFDDIGLDPTHFKHLDNLGKIKRQIDSAQRYKHRSLVRDELMNLIGSDEYTEEGLIEYINNLPKG